MKRCFYQEKHEKSWVLFRRVLGIDCISSFPGADFVGFLFALMRLLFPFDNISPNRSVFVCWFKESLKLLIFWKFALERIFLFLLDHIFDFTLGNSSLFLHENLLFPHFLDPMLWVFEGLLLTADAIRLLKLIFFIEMGLSMMNGDEPIQSWRLFCRYNQRNPSFNAVAYYRRFHVVQFSLGANLVFRIGLGSVPTPFLFGQSGLTDVLLNILLFSFI